MPPHRVITNTYKDTLMSNSSKFQGPFPTTTNDIDPYPWLKDKSSNEFYRPKLRAMGIKPRLCSRSTSRAAESENEDVMQQEDVQGCPAVTQMLLEAAVMDLEDVLAGSGRTEDEAGVCVQRIKNLLARLDADANRQQGGGDVRRR